MTHTHDMARDALPQPQNCEPFATPVRWTSPHPGTQLPDVLPKGMGYLIIVSRHNTKEISFGDFLFLRF